MSNRKKAWIALIPAYQPTALLLELLKKVQEHGFQAVVVNDGSDAESEELFLQAEGYADVLRHEVNKGKGCAIKTGLSYIKERFTADCVIVTLDADGQHRVVDAERLCMVAQENTGEMVLGSRKLGADVPLRSRFGNTVTRFVFKLSTRKSVYDTQTGLRAFGSELIPILLSVEGERYEYEMNVLLICARENIPISEVEIETIYIDGNASSHFDTIKDSYRVYKEILKFSASSFISFLVDYGLYSMLSAATADFGNAGLIVSNIGARFVSASINYSLNRKVVFRSDVSIVRSVFWYAVLAVAILAGNTFVLSLFVNSIGMNRYLAKLCTEILFFIVSWLVQKYFIFQKQTKGGRT